MEKMQKLNKMLVLMLTFVLALGMLCGCVTSDQEEQSSGIQGAATEENPWKIGATSDDNVSAYIADQTLWISGEGKMADYADPSDRPWNDFAGEINNIFLDGEIDSIGRNAFYGIGTATEDGADIFFGTGAEMIGQSAFEGMKFADYVVLTLPEDVESIGSRAFAGSSLQDLHFNGKPDSIADDAFTDVTAILHVRGNENWTDADKGQFGGTLSYKTLYCFEYESIFEGDDASGEGEEYVDEDQDYTYDALIDEENMEGFKFDYYEVISGDLKIDPKEPLIETRLTGDVEVKIYYKKI